MLTLVAVVLAYDMAREMREVRSSAVELVDMDMDMEPSGPGRRGGPLESPRRLRSWTRLEKDMVMGCARGAGEGRVPSQLDSGESAWRPQSATLMLRNGKMSLPAMRRMTGRLLAAVERRWGFLCQGRSRWCLCRPEVKG